MPTGFDELDSALAGGWPNPALVEVLVDVYGIGELQLLLALIRTQLSTTSSSLVVWLNPPYTPNSVAFEQSQVSATQWVVSELSERDVLWAAEQCVRSNAAAAVLAWSSSPTAAGLRRLKLAAMNAQGLAIVFRPLRDSAQPSPANVRVALRPERDGLRVDVIKYEGRKPSTVLVDVDTRSRASVS